MTAPVSRLQVNASGKTKHLALSAYVQSYRSMHRRRLSEMFGENVPAKYKNYPKVGDVLTCIRSGSTMKFAGYGQGANVTKGKKYTVVDNLDMINGQLHVRSDEPCYHTLLSPEILEEFFGYKLQVNCDNCSAATPTAMMKTIFEDTMFPIKLCPKCSQPLGLHCNKRGVRYESFLASSAHCGRCTGKCTWG
jgi:hypothetical protein